MINGEQRPEIISKLSFYLMDKEPLIYLFIINSDFIKDRWGYLAQGDSEGFAGVTYKNNRTVFLYTDSFLNLPLERLYFILIHEAQHVFKCHTKGLHDHLDNHHLVNVAEDAIINTEILQMKFLGIQPKVPEDSGCLTVPTDFKKDYKELGVDAYTTPRLYAWYMKKKELKKKEFILKVKYCKDKDGNYGQAIYEEGGEIVTLEFPSFEDLKSRIKNPATANTTVDSTTPVVKKKNLDDLTPVILAGDENSFRIASGENHGAELEGYFDKNISGVFDEPDGSDGNIIPQEVFIENLVKQSNKMIEQNQSMQDARKAAGINPGNSLSESVQRLLKSQIKWKKEFKQGLNIFLSDRGSVKGVKKSYITHLMNPRSRYGMLARSNIKTATKQQQYIIIAIDTSGSCFYDDYDKERFFTEIDSISKEMEFSNTGKVYTVMWDWGVRQDNMFEYKCGDWKKYRLKGGGGTNPATVFRYLQSRSAEVSGGYIMKINDKENIIIKDKKKLPFLLFLTDGFFYNRLKDTDLGMYQKDRSSLMFLTRNENKIPSGIKRVIYT
jgi:predicted metal-dependent peptidase